MEMGKGVMGRGDGERLTGSGRWERGQWGGGEEGPRSGDFTDGYDELSGWKAVTEFSDFVYPCNTGYPS